MSSELERGVGEPRRFSIASGPFLTALSRLHLTRGDGTPRAWALVAIAWLPLFAGGLVRLTIGQRPAPILHDLSVHVRLLVAIPVLIQAERMLDRWCRSAVNQLYAGGFAERASLDRIIDRAERMRDARIIELALLVALLLGGIAALSGLLAPSRISGIADLGSRSFASIWYATVALPIAQFLMLRWLWRWALWSYVLARLSRLPLATIATHPDHAAGIAFLGSPISAFSGFTLAIGATLSSAWGTQMLDGRASLQAFVPSLVTFLALAVIVGCGPLLLFTGMLYRARHRELERYNGLALEYVRAFHRKWIDARPPSEPVLGTPDLQSLNDLCGSYANLVQLRLVPFSPRSILGIAIAAVLPMLPLLATSMPLDQLLGRIVRTVLGGLPA